MSYGRRKIYSDTRGITAANVMDEVNRAYAVHCQNQSEIEVLWKEYRVQTKTCSKQKQSPLQCKGDIYFILTADQPCQE